MARETIYSHAGLQALQASCSDEARSDEHMYVDLVSLESVRIARESYALLRSLMTLLKRGYICICPQLQLLSIVAGMVLELHKVEHDLLPPLLVQEAKLEGGVLEALVLMKNSANTLLDLAKDFKEALGESLDNDLVSARVEEVALVLKDIAVHVQEGTRNIDFVHERVPFLLKLFNALLATPVRFHR